MLASNPSTLEAGAVGSGIQGYPRPQYKTAGNKKSKSPFTPLCLRSMAGATPWCVVSVYSMNERGTHGGDATWEISCQRNRESVRSLVKTTGRLADWGH